MLRCSPNRDPEGETTTQDELVGNVKQQGYSETYAVTHWEHFEVENGSITFCVRNWPATASWPARCELSACFRGSAGGGLQDAGLGSRRPALLWDVDGSAPFSWVPPSPLPATEGCQQVDYTRKCVVTQFQSSPWGWKLALMWLMPSPAQAGQDARMPSRLIAQVQSQDGRRIMHPTTGRSFQIPLTESPNPRAGQQWQQATATVPGPAMELSEARKDLEQLRQQYHQCEALINDREKEAEELQRQVADLPQLEYFTELEGRLDEESSHRRRCQAELLELRGRPRLFCVLLPGMDAQVDCAIKRHSRNEVAVPSLWQTFEVDFIIEPRDREACDDAWEEVKPVLQSALRRPASYACVLMASYERAIPVHSQNSRATTWYRRHRATIARMVDHLFACIADGVVRNSESVGAASVSLVEVTPEDSNVRNLLADGVAAIPVSDVQALMARTSQEVMEAYDLGMSKLSEKRGHTVLSICIQRYDASAREAACAGRLSIVELTSSHEGCANSDAKTTAERQLAAIAKATQACMERTCEAWVASYRPSVGVVSAPLQAKTFLIATISSEPKDLQASLSILQLTSASSVLQERASSKPDDYGCRRQLAKLLQENQRLRAELAERGRLPKMLQDDDPSALSFRDRKKMFEAPPEKTDFATSSGARTTHSTPVLPSPRERYMDIHRTGGAAQRNCCSFTKETCASDGRRRMHASSCLLPSR